MRFFPSPPLAKAMNEQPLELVMSEKAFAGLVSAQAVPFHRVALALVRRRDAWTRPLFFQLISQADALEALLDDHGARHNRTFSYLRELVASLRGLALAGFSLSHLERRLDGYPTNLSDAERGQAVSAARQSRVFLERALLRLLETTLQEERAQGIEVAGEPGDLESVAAPGPKQILPRNMGQLDLDSDEQKTAEVASRFLQASARFDDLGTRRVDLLGRGAVGGDEHERHDQGADASMQGRCRHGLVVVGGGGGVNPANAGPRSGCDVRRVARSWRAASRRRPRSPGTPRR